MIDTQLMRTKSLAYLKFPIKKNDCNFKLLTTFIAYINHELYVGFRIFYKK